MKNKTVKKPAKKMKCGGKVKKMMEGGKVTPKPKRKPIGDVSKRDGAIIESGNRISKMEADAYRAMKKANKKKK